MVGWKRGQQNSCVRTESYKRYTDWTESNVPDYPPILTCRPLHLPELYRSRNRIDYFLTLQMGVDGGGHLPRVPQQRESSGKRSVNW